MIIGGMERNTPVQLTREYNGFVNIFMSSMNHALLYRKRIAIEIIL
jgi:hypothetical protein